MCSILLMAAEKRRDVTTSIPAREKSNLRRRRAPRRLIDSISLLLSPGAWERGKSVENSK